MIRTIESLEHGTIKERLRRQIATENGQICDRPWSAHELPLEPERRAQADRPVSSHRIGARKLSLAVISGQVGMDREGNIASGAKAQSEQALRNIAACLEANGMRKEDLVKFTVYLTDARSIADYRAAR